MIRSQNFTQIACDLLICPNQELWKFLQAQGRYKKMMKYRYLNCVGYHFVSLLTIPLVLYRLKMNACSYWWSPGLLKKYNFCRFLLSEYLNQQFCIFFLVNPEKVKLQVSNFCCIFKTTVKRKINIKICKRCFS